MVRTRMHGFSLLELMITCAVITLLASIALPSYRQHVVKTHRVQAQTCMLDQAGVMERHFAQTLSYAWAPPSNCVATLEAYTLRYASTAGSYEVTAEPIAGKGDARCGPMTLDQTGATTAAEAGCW